MRNRYLTVLAVVTAIALASAVIGLSSATPRQLGPTDNSGPLNGGPLIPTFPATTPSSADFKAAFDMKTQQLFLKMIFASGDKSRCAFNCFEWDFEVYVLSISIQPVLPICAACSQQLQLLL